MDMDQEAHSSMGIESEVEAGVNVRNQLAIWDTLIEWRIILQKLLVASNQLPQPTDWERIFGEKSDSVAISTQSELNSLLNAFLHLQDAMVGNNRDLFDPQEDEDEEIEDGEIEDGDEEIASDFDDVEERENDVDGQEDVKEEESEDGSEAEDGSCDVDSSRESVGQKRQLSTAGIEEALHERSEYLRESRNRVLDEWYEKTRFSSASSMKQSKSMDSFEQPPSVQIQQILSNQKRLIKRTQLKRSNYVVIGKETENDEYDCEIFDDDDFYHQLLRELIDSKTSNDSDSLSVSRKWLEIQKMRSKMKKKVDTRASKGRKIRFDVHKQLLNFMAPIISHHFTEEAKDELFDSLFQTS